eukprot:scaffold1117_cov379-Prasinococcus_capsulatus_cf.AAC.7
MVTPTTVLRTISASMFSRMGNACGGASAMVTLQLAHACQATVAAAAADVVDRPSRLVVTAPPPLQIYRTPGPRPARHPARRRPAS